MKKLGIVLVVLGIVLFIVAIVNLTGVVPGKIVYVSSVREVAETLNDRVRLLAWAGYFGLGGMISFTLGLFFIKKNPELKE